MSEQFTTLIEKIDRMVNALLGIPQNVGTTVTITERFVREEDGGGGGGQGFASGGVITRWGVPATLHGTPSNPEFVLQNSQLAAAVAKGVSMAMGTPAGAGGGAPVVVHTYLHVDGRQLGHVIQDLTRDNKLRIHPQAITKAGF
jgi:hypothetical protein